MNTRNKLTEVNWFSQPEERVKIEPELEIKDEQCDHLSSGMCTTTKVKMEPGCELDKGNCESLDYEAPATSDIKTSIKIEPGHELKEEIVEEDQFQTTTELKFEETTSELGAEDAVKEITGIERWMSCVPFKAVVKGSSFVPFKMPFSGSEEQPIPGEKSFHIADLLGAFPNIGLVIDLSYYRRTYRVSDLMAHGVQYVNIPVQFKHFTRSKCNDQQLSQFIETCSTYSTMYPDNLIGVHDQLGNRATAYMICKALERSGMSIKLAVSHFVDARGCEIYPATADILIGSRRSWINKFKAKQKVPIRKVEENELKVKKASKAKRRRPNKSERRANEQRRAKEIAANRYKKFLATL